MKLTIQTAFRTLIILFSMTNIANHGMDQQHELAKTMQSCQKKIKAIATLKANFEPKTVHLNGKITLKKTPLGYGCKNCITTLKKTNIARKAQQNWPLAHVVFFVENTKTNSGQQQTYTKTTKNLPLAVLKESMQKQLDSELATREKVFFTILDNEDDTCKADMKKYFDAHRSKLNAQLTHRINTIKEKSDTLPPLLPAHLLYSDEVTLKDIFDSTCNITFTFTQNRELSELVEKFEKNPTIVTLLDNLQLAEMRHTREDYLDKTYEKFLRNAEKQLLDLNVIKKTNSQDSIILSTPKLNILAYENLPHTHGTCGYPQLKQLALEKALNGENATQFVARRQGIGNKRHFTYSLKK